MARSLPLQEAKAQPCKTYDLSSNSKPGKVIIFSHRDFIFNPSITRVGTEHDARRLNETFTDLNFDVESRTDNTVDEIIHKINYYAKEEKFTDFSSLVVVILTHGSNNGVLYAKDKTYHISEVWTPLALSDASVISKPKIFFIQACRTSNENAVEKRTSVQHDAGPTMTNSILPHRKHFFFAFSTAEGLLSYRNEMNGTWYIQSLCENLRRLPGGQNDLMSVLTVVNQSVGEKEHPDTKYGQTPVFVSYLDYKIIISSTRHYGRISYFQPKLSLGDKVAIRSDDVGRSKSINTTVVSDAGMGFIAPEEPATQYVIPPTYTGEALIYYDTNHTSHASKLNNILQALNFRIKNYEVFNGNDIRNTLQKQSQLLNANTPSILVAIFASLGEEKFLDTDDTLFRECSEQFLASKCTALSGKPKMFLFLDAHEQLAKKPASDAPQHRRIQMSNDHADFLHFYAYEPETVDKLFTELSAIENCKEDILNIFTRALENSRKNFRGYLSYFESTLSKNLILGECEREEPYSDDKNTDTLDENTYIEGENQALTAAALLQEGRYSDAITTFNNALLMIENSSDRDHRTTTLNIVRTMSYILVLHLDAKVLPLYDSLIEIRTRILGAKHPDTLLLLNNKAITLGKLERYSEALSLYDKIIENTNFESAGIVMIKSNKAAILSKLKRYEDALQLYNYVIDKKKHVFGISHEETLLSMHSKAAVLGNMKLYKEELKLIDEILKIQQHCIGKKHPDTLNTMLCKAMVSFKLEYNTSAKELFQSVEKNRKKLK